MRTIYVLAVLLALVAGIAQAGSVKLSDISSTIATTAQDGQTITSGSWRSATLYGVCAGTASCKVTVKISYDGTYWRPMLVNAVAGDTTFTFTSSGAAALRIVLPIMAENRLTTAWNRYVWPLNYPYIRVIVKSVSGEMTSNLWTIYYTEE